MTSTGKQNSCPCQSTEELSVRIVAPQASSWLRSYGTFDGGGELMTRAWQGLEHRLAIRRTETKGPFPTRTNAHVYQSAPQFPQKILRKHQVDLLVIECCTRTRPPQANVRDSWEVAVASTKVELRPKVVLESWSTICNTWSNGPTAKGCITRWEKLGYVTRIKFVSCTDIGGSLNQYRIMIARVCNSDSAKWIWPSCSEDSISFRRPMQNLLTPVGLIAKESYVSTTTSIVSEANADPMPPFPGALIRTESGIRRLQNDEYCRGLGYTKEILEQVPEKLARQSTSIYHWEYLSPILTGIPPETPTPVESLDDDIPVVNLISSSSTEAPPSFDFVWRPPDLSVDGDWHKVRVKNLQRACATYENSTVLFKDGLQRLERHRHNYDESGPNPTFLQLLWWEFPPEHWDELRDGFRMNFLKTPPTRLTPNAPMDAAGLEAAREFVDELILLGVFREIDEGMKVLSNAPLFVVPKPGQPGQWRCIADMKKGGQNDCIGTDPCFLPRTGHILQELYAEGYSAVVDLSKYFHNFPTHKDDRPYLGLIHPITQFLYAYFGLPMGSANSPATSGRAGNSFMRKIREDFELFSGVGQANCFWTSFEHLGYDPALGYGFVLRNRHGLALKLWGFVDDFLLHGPTLKSVQDGLTIFLDFALACGFLAHPDKLTKPSQEVKYCGFLYNTVAQPLLKIPLSKRERALAICDHLLNFSVHFEWSRLSLAVAAGILESLSEATPRRYGHTVLRELHTLIHPENSGTGLDPYLTRTKLNDKVRMGLLWWRKFLVTGEGRYVRPSRAGTLIPMFGDGSGTGTGGTITAPDSPQLMWSAVWNLVIYRFTSNYKELNTLLLALQTLRRYLDLKQIRQTTVFYFTDNTVTYYIGASGSSSEPKLHELISNIRLLEIELDIHLNVVHIPGLVMIDQGTDNLSRGIWMSSLHSYMDERALLAAIFAPVTFDWSLLQLISSYVDIDLSNCTYYDWNSEWKERLCFHQTTVWAPPPELGRQVITFLLNMWIEQPYSTAALIILPRTCGASYRGLSRYIQHKGTIYPSKTLLLYPPILPIPIEVFYIAPHTASLPSPTRPQLLSHSNPYWHQQEAATLRGLPPVTIGN